MWQNIERADPNGCWNWTAGTSKSGHGLTRINGRTCYVHRYIYQWFKGEIPAGMIVRHTCDNARCCNPAHLVLGTPGENVADRQERRRSATGERNGRSKLSADQVVELYRRWHLGEGSTRLAREYQVDDRTVRQIVHHERWTSLHLDQLDIPRPRLVGKEA